MQTVAPELRALLSALHRHAQAETLRLDAQPEDAAELADLTRELIDTYIPTSLDELVAYAVQFPPLMLEPVADDVVLPLPPTAALCLRLNLISFCLSSLAEEASEHRLIPGAGQEPGLLDTLRISPVAGPRTSMSALERGAVGDLRAWARAAVSETAAEDWRQAVDQIARAWLPEPANTRAYGDLCLAEESASLATEVPPLDPNVDEISPVECVRANLYLHLRDHLTAQFNQIVTSRPELQAALDAARDLSGLDGEVQVTVAIPDPALFLTRAEAPLAPGEEGWREQAALHALRLLFSRPELGAETGLRITGSSWRYASPAEYCDVHEQQMQRIARQTAAPALFLHLRAGVVVEDEELLRDRIGELHGHPGERCDVDPPLATLLRTVLIHGQREHAETYGIAYLGEG